MFMKIFKVKIIETNWWLKCDIATGSLPLQYNKTGVVVIA